MFRFIFIVFCIPFLVTAQEGITYKSGEIIVKFKTATTFVKNNNQLTSNKPNINTVLSQHSISNAKQIFTGRQDGFANYYTLQFPTTTTVQQIKNVFKNISDVELVSENALGTCSSAPDDPSYTQQWALPKINAETAWKISSGKNNIIVAAIENGIDLGVPGEENFPDPHPDIAPNLWNDNGLFGWNIIEPNYYPYAEVGHGTHVAGIFGAKTNNATGIAGVAGGGYNSEAGAKIMMVKASNTMSYTEDNVSAGIIWAVDHGAKVINMSLGFSVKFLDFGDYIIQLPATPLLDDAITYAYNNGVIMIAAIGNEGSYFPNPNPGVGGGWTTMYPAGYTTMVISVAALNSDDSKRSNSFPSNYADWCTISAPGTDILSTWPRNLIASGYAYDAGTSMAAPLVSGLAALILSYDQTKTLNQIRTILTSTADDISAANAGQDWSGKLGAGRLNAGKALQYVAPPSAPQNLGYSIVSTHPRLTWSANTEFDIVRYDIYRDLGEGFVLINSVNHPATSYDDYDVYINGTNRWSPTVSYYIKAVDNQSMASASSNGISFRYTGLQKDGGAVEAIPTQFSVNQNFPNPFNPTTSVKYALPTDEFVSLTVSNSIGQEVGVIEKGNKKAGFYELQFNASHLPSGIYFYTLRTRNYTETKKMILQK